MGAVWLCLLLRDASVLGTLRTAQGPGWSPLPTECGWGAQAAYLEAGPGPAPSSPHVGGALAPGVQDLLRAPGGGTSQSPSSPGQKDVPCPEQHAQTQILPEPFLGAG